MRTIEFAKKLKNIKIEKVNRNETQIIDMVSSYADKQRI